MILENQTIKEQIFKKNEFIIFSRIIMVLFLFRIFHGLFLIGKSWVHFLNGLSWRFHLRNLPMKSSAKDKEIHDHALAWRKSWIASATGNHFLETSWRDQERPVIRRRPQHPFHELVSKVMFLFKILPQQIISLAKSYLNSLILE